MTQNQGEMDSLVGGEIICITVQNDWYCESLIQQHLLRVWWVPSTMLHPAGGEAKLGPSHLQVP